MKNTCKVAMGRLCYSWMHELYQYCLSNYILPYVPHSHGAFNENMGP